MDSSVLRDRIHTTKRISSSTKIFSPTGDKTNIVLLDFVGCKDYFITDFGAVFHRKRLYTNRKGVISKGYLPMTVLDPYLPYLWVSLATTFGKCWFPINQLLGWSFVPQTDKKFKYFLSQHPNVYPSTVSMFEWKEQLPEDLPTISKYREFMKLIYQE